MTIKGRREGWWECEECANNVLQREGAEPLLDDGLFSGSRKRVKKMTLLLIEIYILLVSLPIIFEQNLYLKKILNAKLKTNIILILFIKLF